MFTGNILVYRCLLIIGRNIDKSELGYRYFSTALSLSSLPAWTLVTAKVGSPPTQIPRFELPLASYFLRRIPLHLPNPGRPASTNICQSLPTLNKSSAARRRCQRAKIAGDRSWKKAEFVRLFWNSAFDIYHLDKGKSANPLTVVFSLGVD